jgi:hypothetical protein
MKSNSFTFALLLLFRLSAVYSLRVQLASNSLIIGNWLSDVVSVRYCTAARLTHLLINLLAVWLVDLLIHLLAAQLTHLLTHLLAVRRVDLLTHLLALMLVDLLINLPCWAVDTPVDTPIDWAAGRRIDTLTAGPLTHLLIDLLTELLLLADGPWINVM